MLKDKHEKEITDELLQRNMYLNFRKITNC